MWFRPPQWIPLILLFSPLLVTGEEVVTCTPLGTIENASFEDGFTGWGFVSGTSGSVVSGDAADGSSYLQASDHQVTGIFIYQHLSNLLQDNTYTISYDYRLVPNSDNVLMSCQLYMYMDSFSTAGRLAQVSKTVYNQNVGWSTLSGSFTPSSSATHTFEIYAYCADGSGDYAGAAIDIDNVVVSGPTSSTCTTVTPTIGSSSTPLRSLSSSSIPFIPPKASSTSLAQSSRAVTSASATFTSIRQTSTPLVTSLTGVTASSSGAVSTGSLSTGTAAITVGAGQSSSHLIASSTRVADSSSSVVGTGSLSTGTAAISVGAGQSSTPLVASLTGVAASSSGVVGTGSLSTGTAAISVGTGQSSTSIVASLTGVTASSSGVVGTGSLSTGTAATTVGAGQSSSGNKFTTSTVLSTRTATITACPSSVTDCPAREKTTQLTTETILVSTTICPVTAVEATKTATIDAGADDENFTTSTILSTRTSTITACPSSVTDCPAREKTTQLTTETIVVSTTICPVTAVKATQTATSVATSVATNVAIDLGASDENFTTSTILSTRIATITACPSSVTDCPAREKTTHLTTETIILSTTICPVTAAEASATSTTTLGSYSSGSGAVSSSGSNFVFESSSLSSSTATVTVTLTPVPESTTLSIEPVSVEANELLVSTSVSTVTPTILYKSTITKVASSSALPTSLSPSSGIYQGGSGSPTISSSGPIFTGGSVSQNTMLSAGLVSACSLLLAFVFVL
ncbi:hypothetical protein N7495_002674 [Penicillium taxi]|uniref:uncharacterized protein n=1 Tax=Penicillium taxi TaxID=168475 RepID=UPI002544E634|nr:uncharacterized protein N7495_002674 [Penicillium taxi]KAJ5902146.1 hypothetical protein N7495_002674 [Penicillium taxi]